MSEVLKSIEEMEFIRGHLTGEIEKLFNTDDQKFCREFLSEFRRLPIEEIEKAKIVYSASREFIQENIDQSLSDYEGFTFNGDNIFRERFIVPIFDSDGRIAGMAGYDSDSDIKYLFTHTTYFSKMVIFYNYQNIIKIYSSDYVILVEGFFDSLRLNSIGIPQNLAPMGTMLSKYHKRVLNRIGLKILMSDGDKPGQKALKYWSELDGKIAIIHLRSREVEDSRKYFNDDGTEEVRTIKTQTKDIDAILKFFPEREKEFRDLVSRIVKESKNPFFRKEEYYF